MSLNKEQERIKSVLELSLSIFEDLDSKEKELQKTKKKLWDLWKAGVVTESIHDAVVYNWGEDKVEKIIEQHKKAKSNGEVS